jgi:hypothetical protein
MLHDESLFQFSRHRRQAGAVALSTTSAAAAANCSKVLGINFRLLETAAAGEEEKDEDDDMLL